MAPATPPYLTPPDEPTVTTSILNGEDLSKETTRELDSVVAPAPLPPVTPDDEPPAITVIQDGVTFRQIEPSEQHTPKTDSAVGTSLVLLTTPPC